MRKYHYLVLFLAGYLVLSPFMLHKLYIEQEKNTEAFVEQTGAEIGAEPSGDGLEMPGGDALAEGNAEAADGTSGQGTDMEEGFGQEEQGTGEASGQEPGKEQAADGASKQETASDGASGETQENAGEAGEDAEETAEEIPPEEFFQDTLFIGDSRTMGLAEYADLDNAVVFANTGMNIYRLYSLKNAVRDQGLYLEDILAERQYRKIYLMLGINELGYDEGQTVKRYEEEVLKLQKLQPDAKIVLEANMHVTTARSGRDAIFNNEGIDRINENIRQIAEKYGFSYIDVNEVFDDETGGLNPEYTHDEVHVLGKYYQQWADWIRENGV